MRRHLIYHVLPVVASNWLENIRQVADRIDLFNGRWIVSIAGPVSTGPIDFQRRKPFSLLPTEQARAELESAGLGPVEIVEVTNNPLQGEVVSFRPLFDRILPEDGYTFYAHTKGVTYPDPDHPSHLWAKLLYEANLDYWPVVEREFHKGKSLVGAMRQSDSPAYFIYSGNFFWFNNEHVRKKRWWYKCDEAYAGLELWAGRHFRRDESACIFGDYTHGLQAYNKNWMAALYRQFEVWKQEHAQSYRKHSRREVLVPGNGDIRSGSVLD